jgi:dephospho-CoA kinase
MDTMITFGLTGGIACGKSTVTKTFRRNGIPLVDADIIARQVVEPGTPGYFKVLTAFGSEFFNEDATLNRAKLGELVFTEKTALDKINQIMGPLIHDEGSIQIGRWLDYLRQQNKPLIVGYDAALIIEQSNHKLFKPLIVVSCPKEIQLERLMKRNQLTKAQAEARINAQMPVEEKIKYADFVIDTSREIEFSRLQTEAVIKHLRTLHEHT